jgi:phage terminase large subunit
MPRNKKEKVTDMTIDARIFNDVYVPYLEAPQKTQIFFGGSSSGKSVFLAQRAVMDVLLKPRNYLILRKVGNRVGESVFNEVKQAIDQFKVAGLFDIHESNKTITCKVNGRQMLFNGLEDVARVKSLRPRHGVVTDIWIEEATEVSKEDYDTLRTRLRGLIYDDHDNNIRYETQEVNEKNDDELVKVKDDERAFEYEKPELTKRIILSFNPIYKNHWIYKTFFKDTWKKSHEEAGFYENKRIIIVKTTYLNNKFLATDDLEYFDELEEDGNQYYRDVYKYGNWGVLGDVIFTNWRVENLSGKKFTSVYRNGLDFGFARDPACLVKTVKEGDTIYIVDGFQQKGLTNVALAEKLEDYIAKRRVLCDNAEPKSIEELRSLGISAVPAKKGKDSVNHGIQYLQQKEIVVDESLTWLIHELNTYQWDKDSDGNTLPRPVKKDDHGIDALRYAYSDTMSSNVFWGCDLS